MKLTEEQRREHRRKRELIRRAAENEIMKMRTAPNGAVLRSPKVMFGILVVMGVLASLFMATNATPQRELKTDTGLMRTAKSVENLAIACGRFRFHVGRFPTTYEGLPSLAVDPGVDGWLGPYVQWIYTDIWKTRYVYREPETDDGLPTIFSCGPDKTAGTQDDIVAPVEAFNVGTSWTNGWLRKSERAAVKFAN